MHVDVDYLMRHKGMASEQAKSIRDVLSLSNIGLIPGNTVPGIPGNFPKIFIPGRSREHKTIPGNNGNEN